MATNIPLKFRKKGYDSSDDGGEGIVVFNSDEKNIYVGGDKYGETKLFGLTDTAITNPSNDQALVYDGTSSKWVNKKVQQVYMGPNLPQDNEILIWIDTSSASGYDSFLTNDSQPLVTSDNLTFLTIR